MKILKITSVILAIFIIVISAVFVYSKMKQPEIDKNYNQKAIYFFLTNGELFEQVKNHLLTLKEDVHNGDILLVKDRKNYIDVKINNNIEKSLRELVSQSNKIDIIYVAENGVIEFELKSGTKPKGIIYIGTSNEKDAENLLNSFNFATHLKIREHWYYYEQKAGV